MSAGAVCLRCGLYLAPTREAWWADDGKVPTYCRCVHPIPSHDAQRPDGWRVGAPSFREVDYQRALRGRS